MSYEVAKAIVEEKRSVAERRSWWRRAEREETTPLPSWDVGVVELDAGCCEVKQEMVGA